jgi:hypothetical protein
MITGPEKPTMMLKRSTLRKIKQSDSPFMVAVFCKLFALLDLG